MSDSVQREWHFYLDDMIGFAEKVIAYWSIIQTDIPSLLPQLRQLRESTV
jgi:uncharacterized protein with HEPN domain